MSEAEVSRSVVLDAGVEDVWAAVADPERRRLWLDDEDALARAWRVDHEAPGRSLTWTWWHPEDPAGASQVEVVLDEQPDGATRLVVTERLVQPVQASATRMRASAGVSRSAAWAGRLLGLELLLVAAGALVA
jgi:uncharacterized protein YndB with AHSA1/START domain